MGTPRGPFEIISIQGVPQYPVLWSHNAPRERSLVVLPDSEGEVRPGCGRPRRIGLETHSLAATLQPRFWAKFTKPRRLPHTNQNDWWSGVAQFHPGEGRVDLTSRLVGQYDIGIACLLVDRISTAEGPCDSHNHSVA